MLEAEIISALESLEKLQDYYRDEYEYYLSKAMSAKQHQERIEALLQDLDNRNSSRLHESQEILNNTKRTQITDRNYSYASRTANSFEETSIPMSLNGFLLQEELTDSKSSIELNSLSFDPESSKAEEKLSNSADYRRETTNSNREYDAVGSFLELSKTVMPGIEEVFKLEPNKTLHLSYLQKTLNTKLNLQLSKEAVKLYLDRAIERGYCVRDAYDKECYCYLAEAKQPKSEPLTSEREASLASLSSNKNAAKNVRQKKLYNLPSSSKLKVTLLKTVKGFLAERNPDVFTSQDIIDYLYSKKQQSNWSKERSTKVRQAIGNVLGRDSYLGTEWERVKLGTYRSLS